MTALSHRPGRLSGWLGNGVWARLAKRATFGLAHTSAGARSSQEVAPAFRMKELLSLAVGRLKRHLRRAAARQTDAAPFANLDHDGPTQRSAAILLHIPTSDGSGQACHPSVVHVPQGFGGYGYWMANTPYPGNAHKLENPELFASQDGLFWQVPDGVHNPLVPAPPGDGRHYHSDPSLLHHDGQLWLYFRTSDEEACPRRDWLSVIVSADGRRWSRSRVVLEDDRGALLLSPSVRVIDHQFIMWTVEAETGSAQLAVKRRTSTDGLHWSAPDNTELEWSGAPLEPWHIEVTETGAGLVMIFSAREHSRRRNQRWCSAIGDGLCWRVTEHGRNELCAFEAGKPYKPSFLPAAPGRPSGWLYTSSTGADGAWYTALRPGPFS